MYKKFLAAIVFALLVLPAAANDAIKVRVLKEFGKEPAAINPTPIPDLYEVVIGSRVIYLSKDARIGIAGDMYDLDKQLNMTNEKRNGIAATALEAVGDKNMVVFAPKNVKHTITVFTDIDCGYCQKLHSEIEEYNKLGIKVRYMAYPRSGPDSPSFEKYVSVWCADDRKKAMTMAKKGGTINKKTCNNPIAEQFALGHELGVTGTPAIFFEDGSLYPRGYAPANQLIQILEQGKQAKK